MINLASIRRTFMRNFTPFLFLLISVAGVICGLFSLGCGSTTEKTLNTHGAQSQPDKVLRVGDKLPSFTSNDVVSRVNTLWSRKLITGFQKNGWIELKNGTRYVCVSSEGCEVANFTIIKGTIEVYYRKER